MMCSSGVTVPAESRARGRFQTALKGELLRALKESGLSLSTLAARCGRNKAAVSRALALDNNIETETMFKLAWALGKEWDLALRDPVVPTGVFTNMKPEKTSPAITVITSIDKASSYSDTKNFRAEAFVVRR